MSLAETIPQQLQSKIDNIIDNVASTPWMTEADKTAYIEKDKNTT